MQCTSINPSIQNCDIEKIEIAKLVEKKLTASTVIKRKL